MASEPDAAQSPTDPATEQVPNESSQVFVSYASQDGAVAAALVEALERHGLKCWIAPRDVVPGSLYADGIVRAISGAKVFVLVLSEHAIASSHVGKEIERASSNRLPIIALRTDLAPLTPAFQYFLSESQWIDIGAAGMDAASAKLVEAARRHLTRKSTVEGGAPPDRQTVARKPAVPRKAWLTAAAVAVVALALAYFVVSKFWLSKQPASERPAAAVAPAPTPGAPAISDKSVAVLPFVDMSEKKDQEYFGDGMAEEILDLLVKVPGLTVIGRTSSFQFKGKNADLRTIGTQLNASYVLEGSVRKSGEQIRITAQLINTRTGTHEWSETYNRPAGDVLKLQDAIAAAVVRELQLTVAPKYGNARPTVKDTGVYDLILRGRHAYDRSDKEGVDEAATLFQQALARDPTSANAAAELASTYIQQVLVGSLTPASGMEQARRAATNALKLDPKNVLARVVVADVHMFYDWDWAASERELKQLATEAPGNVEVLANEAWLSEALGRSDEALMQNNAALAQDPLNPEVLQNGATIQESRGHLSEAETAMRRALDIRPSYGYGHYILGLILLERGDRDAALREMQQETIDDGKREGLAIVCYALGKKADADAALAEMLQKDAEGNAFEIAEVYAFRGQADEAMHWLDRAHTQKDVFLYSVKRSWLFKNLRADLRYKAFLRKMNLPE